MEKALPRLSDNFVGELGCFTACLKNEAERFLKEALAVEPSHMMCRVYEKLVRQSLIQDHVGRLVVVIHGSGRLIRALRRPHKAFLCRLFLPKPGTMSGPMSTSWDTISIHGKGAKGRLQPSTQFIIKQVAKIVGRLCMAAALYGEAQHPNILRLVGEAIVKKQRLEGYEEHRELIKERDDLYIEYITLVNLTRASPR